MKKLIIELGKDNIIGEVLFNANKTFSVTCSNEEVKNGIEEYINDLYENNKELLLRGGGLRQTPDGPAFVTTGSMLKPSDENYYVAIGETFPFYSKYSETNPPVRLSPERK